MAIVVEIRGQTYELYTESEKNQIIDRLAQCDGPEYESMIANLEIQGVDDLNVTNIDDQYVCYLSSEQASHLVAIVEECDEGGEEEGASTTATTGLVYGTYYPRPLTGSSFSYTQYLPSAWYGDRIDSKYTAPLTTTPSKEADEAGTLGWEVGEEDVAWGEEVDPDLGSEATTVNYESTSTSMSPTMKIALYGGLGVASILGIAYWAKKR